MQKMEFRAMGCEMLIALDSDNSLAPLLLEQSRTWFEQWEETLSRFRPTSELNRINNARGMLVRANADLIDVLAASLHAAKASNGLVTPAVLDAVESAGYDSSFELIRDGAAQSSATPWVGDWRQIEYDKTNSTVYLPPDVRIDLGGIAKGWAADRAMGRLASIGAALVDTGGDIAVSGPMLNGEGWQIAVADPFAPDSNIANLVLNGGAIATSGRDYRHWEQLQVARHHIIDPRTALPSDTDVLTATVVAPTAKEAEVAAKVAFLLGGSAGMEWLETQDLLAGLLVLENGQMLQSRRLKNYLWEPLS